jgi:hypothetical protein
MSSKKSTGRGPFSFDAEPDTARLNGIRLGRSGPTIDVGETTCMETGESKGFPEDASDGDFTAGVLAGGGEKELKAEDGVCRDGGIRSSGTWYRIFGPDLTSRTA